MKIRIGNSRIRKLVLGREVPDNEVNTKLRRFSLRSETEGSDKVQLN
jgi:hypothetical protein